jgi:hypothetical protein
MRIQLQYREIARLRFYGDNRGSRVCAQKPQRCGAYIRAGVDNRRDLATLQNFCIAAPDALVDFRGRADIILPLTEDLPYHGTVALARAQMNIAVAGDRYTSCRRVIKVTKQELRTKREDILDVLLGIYQELPDCHFRADLR